MKIDNRINEHLIVGMLHDLKNRMVGISSTMYNLKSELRGQYNYSNKQIHNHIKLVEDEIESIEFILRFFRHQTDETEMEYNIKAIIYDFMKYFSKVHNDILFRFNCDEEIRIKVNILSFGNMIFELLKNSIYAVLQTKSKNKKIKMSLSKIEKSFRITLNDNGIGIPNEHKNQIYEIGFSTKEKGSGLGLHFIKNYVENKLKGEIQLISSVSKGSTFIIDIPEFVNYID